ncbi:cadmium-translocating P-type ATPase [Megasphaera hexanoica]|uniref:Cd(2+)-exporting ATPase n=1 Tax=Megasphaera hexanoica TaxID=1675036 RepID=A0A848BR03_9FIRM|nr:heavy metal translocating P-type ATPase [Megasphaera hexanoica]NME27540.1 cadmium-translocating P-type ATPase [Megasphaera hexanoica]
MEKVFILKGLDCPNCSAKIEKEVGELEGITSSTVNLMKQTLTITLDEDMARSITPVIETIVHTHEPDVEVQEKDGVLSQEGEKDEEDTHRRILRLSAGAIVYIAIMILHAMIPFSDTAYLAGFVAAYFILGYDVLWQALRNITHGQIFDEHFLMSISTIGAFGIGEYPEAVAVMLFYQIGEWFQDMAVDRSRRSISGLMDIRPDVAHIRQDGKEITVAPDTIAIGSTIIVHPGERIPLDGQVISGSSLLDTRALTGESVPRRVHSGDTALSGCIAKDGVIEIKVSHTFGESTASKIIDLVQNAASRKAPTERFITRFCRYYTPFVVFSALLLGLVPPLFFGGLWADWLIRSFIFLVISCPCALVISIPLTFFSGIGAASRKGILVKGSNYLEALTQLGTVVFDKTGTLTKGVFCVTAIDSTDNFSKDTVLHLAALAESQSRHPIAQSIRQAWKNPIDTTTLSDYQELSGLGICVVYRGKEILAGNETLLHQKHITFTPSPAAGTKVYIAYGGSYAGCLHITDEIKEDSRQAIQGLKDAGVSQTVMLTGDAEDIGRTVSQKLGLDTYYAQLLPQDKVDRLEELDAHKQIGKKLAFVGDGINDAPVLARADVGIAMGGLGSDAAIEAADVVLMTDEPSKLVTAIRVARATKGIAWQNIVLALGIKGLLLILGALGMATMWEAVFGDVGVMILAVLNSMRALRA